MDAFDAGELQRSPHVEERKARHQQYAKAMFKQDFRANIRLSAKDLRGLQKKALAEGMVPNNLHMYVEGRLHENR